MSHKIITFHYTLTDADGVEIESSVQRGEPVTFMSGFGMIVPGLEKEVINFVVGDKRTVAVKAEEAYGLIDFKRFIQVPLDQLPKQEIKVGDIFQSNTAPMPFTVKEVTETHAVLDGNHPLAGEDLVFNVEIVDLRDATEEEIEEIKKQITGGMLPPEAAPDAEPQA